MLRRLAAVVLLSGLGAAASAQAPPASNDVRVLQEGKWKTVSGQITRIPAPAK